MALYIMAGIIPALFLVGIGQAFRPGDEQGGQTESWTGYLLAGLLVLVAAILITYNLGEQISAFILLLLPSALAVFAQIVLWLVRTRFQDVGRSRKLLALLLASLIVLGALIPLTDLFIGGIVLIGGLLLAADRRPVGAGRPGLGMRCMGWSCCWACFPAGGLMSITTSCHCAGWAQSMACWPISS